MAEAQIADDPRELTAAYVTDALQAYGYAGTVDAVRCTRIGTGQIGASYRLDLETRGDAALPSSVVAKLAAGSPAARERVKQGFEKEVLFYRHLAPLTRVRTPLCYAGAITADLTAFTLLLEDLAPGLPGHQVTGCSVAEARAAIANLAALHAPLWDAAELDAHARWLAPSSGDTGRFLGDLMVGAVEEFLTLFEGRLEAADRETLRGAAAATGEWAAGVPGVRSVVHGDYRLDNLMFGVNDGPVAAVDWQTASSGAPTRDLAYFLETSLATEDRRRYEPELLTTYADALAAAGIAYPHAQLERDYRRDLLQGPMITVLGCTYATAVPSPVSDAMFLAMATRSCAAIRDAEAVR